MSTYQWWENGVLRETKSSHINFLLACTSPLPLSDWRVLRLGAAGDMHGHAAAVRHRLPPSKPRPRSQRPSWPRPGPFFAALLLLPFLQSYQSTNPIARFDPNTKELLGLLPTQAHFNGTRRMRTLLVSLLCLSFDTFSKVEPTVGGCSTCHCTVAASTKSQRCKLELQNVSHFHLIWEWEVSTI